MVDKITVYIINECKGLKNPVLMLKNTFFWEETGHTVFPRKIAVPRLIVFR